MHREGEGKEEMEEIKGKTEEEVGKKKRHVASNQHSAMFHTMMFWSISSIVRRGYIDLRNLHSRSQEH